MFFAFLHNPTQDVFAFLLAHLGQLAVEQRLGFGKLDLQDRNKQVHLQSSTQCCMLTHAILRLRTAVVVVPGMHNIRCECKLICSIPNRHTCSALDCLH